tara:strand:+ start:341 stop:547 length:207 start_codon:yes stop_codon:yes gene_type:complete
MDLQKFLEAREFDLDNAYIENSIHPALEATVYRALKVINLMTTMTIIISIIAAIVITIPEIVMKILSL